MNKVPFVVFDFWELEADKDYTNLAEIVISRCFEVEQIVNKNLYINVIFTIPSKIKEINSKYRNIDKETDVLSFPMLEKIEIINRDIDSTPDTLGDIIISIDRVKEQAIEYGHSFNRELAYMLVHGFYHLMGFDHILGNDKIIMREKEEKVLNLLNIVRE